MVAIWKLQKSDRGRMVDDMDKRFEELKRELFDWGYDYIEEFLGCEIDYDWDKDTIDNLMDEVYQQMPEEELEVFYQKFCIE